VKEEEERRKRKKTPEQEEAVERRRMHCDIDEFEEGDRDGMLTRKQRQMVCVAQTRESGQNDDLFGGDDEFGGDVFDVAGVVNEEEMAVTTATGSMATETAMASTRRESTASMAMSSTASGSMGPPSNVVVDNTIGMGAMVTKATESAMVMKATESRKRRRYSLRNLLAGSIAPAAATTSCISGRPGEIITVDEPITGTRSHGPDYGVDDRSPICIFSSPPESPWMNHNDIKKLKLMMERGIPNFWDTLVGGRVGTSRRRMFTPNLAECSEIHNLVEKCMSGYITWVQKQYPALTHYKLAVLKTYPGAKSQYESCYYRLHSDYGDDVNTRPPTHRPISLIVAIDEFEMVYLRDRNNRRRDITSQMIYPGQAMMFTNYCLHAGGASTLGKICYRLFAYMVSDRNDLPNGKVNHYKWHPTNDDETDDVIKDTVTVNEGYNKNDKQLDKVRSSRGRHVKKTNHYRP
jgi:hypothetical protein